MNIERQFSQEIIPENTANYEGNDSLVLIERLGNFEIKEQLIRLYEEAYETRAATGKLVTRDVVDPETGASKRNPDGSLVLESVQYIPPEREEIERRIDSMLEEVSAVTDIGYLSEHRSPTNEVMNLNWKIPQTGKAPTQKQWSIIEAHEKGHNVRRFGHVDIRDFFNNHYAQAFDLSQMEFTEEVYEIYKKEDPEISREKAKEIFTDYMSDPMELTERMSQLKNYFGMKGSEEFTKVHLDYAREHYLKDTEFDNLMTPFFQAISLEKEEQFLALMNSAGI